MEVTGPIKDWFVHVTAEGQIQEFDDIKSADRFSPSEGIILDVKRNKLIRKADKPVLTEVCRRRAAEKGYLIVSSKESAGLGDLLDMFREFFSLRTDLLLFLITVTAAALSNYLSTYSDVVTGQTLTNLVTSQVTQHNLTATAFICSHLYDCQQENGGKIALILTLLLIKLMAFFFESGNVFFHSVLRDMKKVSLKKYLFRHALSQDMTLIDSKTSHEMRNAMNPDPIIDIISWKIPYLLTDVLTMVFVVYHMANINNRLTLISIFFIVLTQIMQYPLEKVIMMMTMIMLLTKSETLRNTSSSRTWI